ncbi:hypothetical protein [uncultured Planktosalinus sp.]|uniref:hypothetical protein n=1 Tax=uncultured Planktosalinus sp. TaxID=1810935 RepID=UPI0030D7FA9A
MNINLHSKDTFLFLLVVIFIGLNMIVISKFEIEISRMVRVLTAFTFFTFFVFYKKYWIGFVFFALILFTLRDLLIVNYEMSSYKTSSFIFTILAYIALIYYGIKKLKITKFTSPIAVFITILVCLNLFNMYYLSEILTDKLDNGLQLVLFYLQGGILLILAFIAYLYYDRFFGKTPLHYLFFVLCFVFSDLSGLAAYFYEIDVAFYFERIFYILGLYLLVNFAFTVASSENESELRIEQESYL